MFEDQTVELLPERTTMSAFNVRIASPTINVSTVNQTATAVAIGGNGGLFGRGGDAAALAVNVANVRQRG
jgi:hypothetical protein